MRTHRSARRLLTAVLACACGLGAGAALASGAHATAFQSPTGNIGCVVLKDYTRCDIAKRDWRAPRRPASCDLEWGDAIGISRNGRRGAFACHGDTARDSHARKLAYGRSVVAGAMRCTSRTDGVRCTNGKGHGFFISKQSYRRF